MTESSSKLIRRFGVMTLMGLVVAGAFCVGLKWERRSQAPIKTHSRSFGPTVSQLEKIGELAPVRIHVADVLVAEGDGYRGSWLIKGEALLSCDVSKARITSIDSTARTATLQLPPLSVSSARVDHEKTKTWSVEKTTWLPWSGDQGALRDSAMTHAQWLIEAAAGSDENIEASKVQTELLIRQMYDLVEWSVSVEWK